MFIPDFSFLAPVIAQRLPRSCFAPLARDRQGRYCLYARDGHIPVLLGSFSILFAVLLYAVSLEKASWPAIAAMFCFLLLIPLLNRAVSHTKRIVLRIKSVSAQPRG